MKTINRVKNIKPKFSTCIKRKKQKIKTRKPRENIFKKPMKIETIKLQRKTYKKNQKKKKRGNEKDRFFLK